MSDPIDPRTPPNHRDRPLPGVSDAAGATGTSHAFSPRPRLTAVLTRPGEQSATLARTLEEGGIDTVAFPLIDIKPNPDTRDIDAALRGIHRFSLVFFVSPNAIEQAFERAHALGVPLAASLACRDGIWPIVAVVGPGSAQALARYGVRSGSHRLLAPAGALAEATSWAQEAHASSRAPSDSAAVRYDSETLVAALDAADGRAALSGRDVLIVRGDGGREWFADALRDAGARVTPVTAYQRAVPQPDDAAWARIEALLDGAPHVWVLTSSEGIRNLDALARSRFGAGGGHELERGRESRPVSGLESDPERGVARLAALKRAPVIVTHPRIAAAATRAGFDTITNPGAGDANIVRAVLAASEQMAIQA